MHHQLTRQVGLTLDRLEDMADQIYQAKAVPLPRYLLTDGVVVQFKGLVIAKERPRHTANHTYTPKRTRDFEEAVKVEGKRAMHEARLAPYTRPVAVELYVYENIPQSWGVMKKRMAEQGLIKPDKRDLDNQIKAIMDALNGICFVDDNCITQIHATRLFGEEGFHLNLFPVGISYTDAQTICNILAVKAKNGKR